ncbi:hypothetical protein B0H17DRAFT_1127129 [Mycena rosella]|uniref:Uncharacterized protein n=1 Tax=Mycena rosella TaxID=1033263 RepID=A0AAD7GSC8_MYCRO|nr:hypothetical protein B0H17DRAFT_1127129 [Mycena rosella]
MPLMTKKMVFSRIVPLPINPSLRLQIWSKSSSDILFPALKVNPLSVLYVYPAIVQVVNYPVGNSTPAKRVRESNNSKNDKITSSTIGQCSKEEWTRLEEYIREKDVICRFRPCTRALGMFEASHFDAAGIPSRPLRIGPGYALGTRSHGGPESGAGTGNTSYLFDKNMFFSAKKRPSTWPFPAPEPIKQQKTKTILTKFGGEVMG